MLKLPGNSRLQRLGDQDLPSLVKRLTTECVIGETDDPQSRQHVATATRNQSAV